MNDTSPQIEEMVCEFFRRKTPQERFKIGCEMYETSRYLVKEAILRETPDMSEVELKQKIFLQFYGNDFPKEKIGAILAHLAEHG